MTPRPRPGEPSGELNDEPVHRERERLDVGDRRRQIEPARVARWRHERRSRVGDEAARTVEEGDEVRADAPGQRRARQRARLPEGGDAGGGERRDDGGIGIGERERQGRKRIEESRASESDFSHRLISSRRIEEKSSLILLSWARANSSAAVGVGACASRAA